MSTESKGITRRELILQGGRLLLTAATATTLPGMVAAEAAVADTDGPQDAGATGPLTLSWLDTAPRPGTRGVSWGVPWPRGTVKSAQHFSLTASRAGELPLTYRPLAYWPDGSVKWTAFDAVLPLEDKGGFRLASTSRPGAAPGRLKVWDTAQAVEIDTGVLRCSVPREGNQVIKTLQIGDTVVAQDGQLICWLQDQPEASEHPAARIRYTGQVEQVAAEQRGPVRAVVKITGTHSDAGGGRRWLPYTLRLYFYSGQTAVRAVYSFVYDGDQDRDFIGGLGIQFRVPFREEHHNRHVRFSGAGQGLFSEPVQPAMGREPLKGKGGEDLYAVQLEGGRLPDARELNEAGRQLLADWAVWSDYKLTQLSADGMTLTKRTGPRSSWLHVASTARSEGLAYVGDVTGGLAVAVRNFWQCYPASLEVRDAASSAATLQAWLWSPDAAAMDLRHYDLRAHGLKSSYEDVQPGFSTPHGIAHTSELTFYPTAGVPDREEVVSQVALNSRPPLLRCTPAYYHSCRIFGPWSLPDTSTALKRKLETQLERMFDFYHRQVEMHRWYGFWNYGDIMHTYDAYRHSWMYDIGGYAWMNTEEMCDVWLWYSFLRTGRPDIFRMAEAMTRHTQEVDVYHAGRFAGLGSRHNVSHWGDGAKELRISQAFLKRFYYYLSTDERMGDLISEVADADQALARVDPLREILPPGPYPTHIRSGPDWLAAAGNWLAAWERTGDSRYRDRITTGMKALAAMPDGLLGSLSFGYDPATHMLYDVPRKQPLGQFLMIMGGAELVYELDTLLEVPAWSEAWLKVCDRWARTTGGDMAGPRAAAFAACKKQDAVLGRLAWERMAEPGDGTGMERFDARLSVVRGPRVIQEVEEIPRAVASGHLSQWALNIIGCLEMAGRWAPRT